MKLKRLNDNRLQIIISNKDLLARNMKKWDLVPHSPLAQALFQEILEKAAYDCDFEVLQDTALLVEAYPIVGDSLLLILTKVSDEEGSLASLLNEDIRLALDKRDKAKPKKTYDVYIFDSLDNIYQLAEIIDTFEIRNSLYYDKARSEYLLIILEDINENGRKDLLLEYGNKAYISENYLQEHCSLIVSNNALEKFKV